MDYTYESSDPGTASVGVLSRVPAGRTSPLTGGTAIVFSVLINAHDHSASFDELADLYWPNARPLHWRGLVSFYGRWLQERLAPGWAVTEGDGRLHLSAESGLIEEWVSAHGAVTSLQGRTWRPPTASSRANALSDDSPLDTFRVFTRRPAQPSALDPVSIAAARTTSSRCCADHRATSTSLPSLTWQEPFTVATYRSNQQAPEPLAWKEMLAAAGHTPGFAFVAGAAPDIPFGDLAAAFAPARWQLLDIEGRTEQARAAKAWRIIAEHLPPDDQPGRKNTCATIFDAHRLDAATLELAQLLVRFPFADNIRITLVGDAAGRRPGWQQLLRSLAESRHPRFALCPDCDPILLSGCRIDQQAALTG